MSKKPVPALAVLCPEHRKLLIGSKTKFGIRYACPVSGCTVVCWEGNTSHPADQETRQARMDTHELFDQIWKSGIMTRGKAYKKMAAHLGIKKKDCHIGQFSKKMALRVQEFAKTVLER